MQTEIRELVELIPYENNPRHNDAAVDAVAESIRQCGYIAPIIIDEDGVILAGHTRFKALQKLGYSEVEVVIKAGLTDDQKRKYRLLDNKTNELAEWDFEKLMEELEGLDFGGLDLDWFPDAGTEGDPDADETEKLHEDDFEQVDTVEPKSKSGELYQLGQHRLICGDATDPETISRLMAGTEADLLLTDPPYNVDYSSTIDALRKWDGSKASSSRSYDDIENDKMSAEEFKAFLVKALTGAIGALRPGAAIYVFHSDKERLAFQEAFQEAGGTYRQALIWVKNQILLGRQDYQWQHEPILYGGKLGAGHYFTPARDNSTVIDDAKPKDLSKMSKADLIAHVKELRSALQEQRPTDVLRFEKPISNDIHPTMKPIKLVGYLMANSTRPGETVLDIFGGSGSTLIAAEQLGRRCFTAEIAPKYVDAIIQRWEALTGRKAVKLS